MQTSFIVFESLMAVLFIIGTSHAIKRGKQYVIELVVAAVYGVLLEILTLIQLETYTYGDFLVKIHGAPIAIGLGWAIIIYAAMATTDKLGIAQKVQPFMVALLALNIDFSMDAIAIREGFWTWDKNGIWFGVPLGNFFAWFIVAFSFSYFVYHFRENKKFQNLYPVLSMVLSLTILLILDGIWFFYLTEMMRIFILVNMLFLSAIYILLNKGQLIKNNEFDWKVFSVPLVFHMFFLTLLLINQYRTDALILISSLMLMTGLYIHFLPSFNTFRKDM